MLYIFTLSTFLDFSMSNITVFIIYEALNSCFEECRILHTLDSQAAAIRKFFEEYFVWLTVLMRTRSRKL